MVGKAMAIDRRKHLKLRRKCDKCSLRFYSHFCLFLHLRVHLRTYSSGWFSCQHCAKRFNKLVNAVKHRQRHLRVKGEHPKNHRDTLKFTKVRRSVTDSYKQKDLINKRTQPDKNIEEIGDQNEVALKFIDQLRAALCLDNNVQQNNIGNIPMEDFQISEISSSSIDNNIVLRENLIDHSELDKKYINHLDNVVPNVTNMHPTEQKQLNLFCGEGITSLGNSNSMRQVELKLLESFNGKETFNCCGSNSMNQIEPKSSELPSSQKATTHNGSNNIYQTESIPSDLFNGNETMAYTENVDASNDQNNQCQACTIPNLHQDSQDDDLQDDGNIDLHRNKVHKNLKNATCSAQATCTMPIKYLKQEINARKASKAEATVDHKLDRKYACCFCKAKFVCLSRLNRHKRVIHKMNIKISGSSFLKNNLKKSEVGDFDLLSIIQEEDEDVDVVALDGPQLSNAFTISGNESVQNKNLDNAVDGVNEGKSQDIKLKFLMDQSNEKECFSLQQKEVKVNSDSLTSVNENGIFLLNCELCNATFSTAYGKNQHLLKRHSVNNQTKEAAANVNKNGSNGLVVSPCAMASNCDKKNDFSTICNICDINFETVKQQLSHTLHQHGTEITFDNETYLFQTEDFPQKQIQDGESTNKLLTDLFTDDKEVSYGKNENSCKICHLRFARRWNLKNHMQKQHNIIVKKTIKKSKKRLKHFPKSEKHVGPYAQYSKANLQLTQYSSLHLARKQGYENNTHQTIESESSSEISKDEKAGEFWKADFVSKSFACIACEFNFAGFFILRKHLASKHGISLDSNGNRLSNANIQNPDIASKVVNDVGKSSSTIVHEKILPLEGKLKSLVKVSSVTKSTSLLLENNDNYQKQLEGESSLKNDDFALSKNKTSVINGDFALAKNTNGMYQCPMCSFEFDNLIDRYIHIVDNHNKTSTPHKRRCKDSTFNEDNDRIQSDDQGTTKVAPITQGINNDEQLKCSVCGAAFKAMRNFKNHLIHEHNISYSSFTRNKNTLKDNNITEPSKEKELLDKQCEEQNSMLTDFSEKNKDLMATLKNNNGDVKTLKNIENPITKSTDLSASTSKHVFTCTRCKEKFTNLREQREHLANVHDIKTKTNTARKSFAPNKSHTSRKPNVILKTDLSQPNNVRTEGFRHESSPIEATATHNQQFASASANTLSDQMSAGSNRKKPSKKMLKITRGSKTCKLSSFQCSQCSRCYSTLGNLKKHARSTHASNGSLISTALIEDQDNNEATSKNQREPSDCDIKKTKPTLVLGNTAESSCIATKHHEATDNGWTESNGDTNLRKGLYRCLRCKKEFSVMRDWKEHDKLYCTKRSCHSVNGNTAPDSSNAQESMKGMNDPPARYQCELCNVVFSYATQLKRHQLYGACSREYVCRIYGCGESFTTESSYKKHMEYTCTICHSQLSSERNLKRHYRFVHKIVQTLNCDLCGDTFDDPISLAFHNKENHLQA